MNFRLQVVFARIYMLYSTSPDKYKPFGIFLAVYFGLSDEFPLFFCVFFSPNFTGLLMTCL